MAVIRDATSRWPVDRNRIYLTGLSLGGHGTWNTATRYPDTFAAIAPISGRGTPQSACALVDVPIWTFHGVLDRVVAAADNQAMVDAVRACGGTPGLTLYPDRGHDAWTETYEYARLYDWFLSHQRPGG
jgi:predicted peptidase